MERGARFSSVPVVRLRYRAHLVRHKRFKWNSEDDGFTVRIGDQTVAVSEAEWREALEANRDVDLGKDVLRYESWCLTWLVLRQQRREAERNGKTSLVPEFPHLRVEEKEEGEEDAEDEEDVKNEKAVVVDDEPSSPNEGGALSKTTSGWNGASESELKLRLEIAFCKVIHKKSTASKAFLLKWLFGSVFPHKDLRLTGNGVLRNDKPWPWNGDDALKQKLEEVKKTMMTTKIPEKDVTWYAAMDAAAELLFYHAIEVKDEAGSSRVKIPAREALGLNSRAKELAYDFIASQLFGVSSTPPTPPSPTPTTSTRRAVVEEEDSPPPSPPPPRRGSKTKTRVPTTTAEPQPPSKIKTVAINALTALTDIRSNWILVSVVVYVGLQTYAAFVPAVETTMAYRNESATGSGNTTLGNVASSFATATATTVKVLIEDYNYINQINPIWMMYNWAPQEIKTHVDSMFSSMSQMQTTGMSLTIGGVVGSLGINKRTFVINVLKHASATSWDFIANGYRSQTRARWLLSALMTAGIGLTITKPIHHKGVTEMLDRAYAMAYMTQPDMALTSAQRVAFNSPILRKSYVRLEFVDQPTGVVDTSEIVRILKDRAGFSSFIERFKMASRRRNNRDNLREFITSVENTGLTVELAVYHTLREFISSPSLKLLIEEDRIRDNAASRNFGMLQTIGSPMQLPSSEETASSVRVVQSITTGGSEVTLVQPKNSIGTIGGIDETNALNSQIDWSIFPIDSGNDTKARLVRKIFDIEVHLAFEYLRYFSWISAPITLPSGGMVIPVALSSVAILRLVYFSVRMALRNAPPSERQAAFKNWPLNVAAGFIFAAIVSEYPRMVVDGNGRASFTAVGTAYVLTSSGYTFHSSDDERVQALYQRCPSIVAYVMIFVYPLYAASCRAGWPLFRGTETTPNFYAEPISDTEFMFMLVQAVSTFGRYLVEDYRESQRDPNSEANRAADRRMRDEREENDLLAGTDDVNQGASLMKRFQEQFWETYGKAKDPVVDCANWLLRFVRTQEAKKKIQQPLKDFIANPRGFRGGRVRRRSLSRDL